MIKKIFTGLLFSLLALILLSVFAPNTLRNVAGFVLSEDEVYELLSRDDD